MHKSHLHIRNNLALGVSVHLALGISSDSDLTAFLPVRFVPGAEAGGPKTL